MTWIFTAFSSSWSRRRLDCLYILCSSLLQLSLFLLLCISIEIVVYRRAPTSEDCRPLWVLARTPLCVFLVRHLITRKGFLHTLGELGKIRGPIPNRRLPLVKQTNLRDVKRLICTQKRFIDFRFASFFFLPSFIALFFFYYSFVIYFADHWKRRKKKKKKKKSLSFLKPATAVIRAGRSLSFSCSFTYRKGGRRKFGMERACLMLFFFVKGKKKGEEAPIACVFWWWARYY